MHSYRFIIERDDGVQRWLTQTQYTSKKETSLPEGIKEEIEKIICEAIGRRIRTEINDWEKEDDS